MSPAFTLPEVPSVEDGKKEISLTLLPGYDSKITTPMFDVSKLNFAALPKLVFDAPKLDFAALPKLVLNIVDKPQMSVTAPDWSLTSQLQTLGHATRTASHADLPNIKKQEIGVIFHWGIYSVPAYDTIVSAKRRRTQNGSEWYAKRLSEKGGFRPISGWKETQEYHKQKYGDAKYSAFADSFKAEKYNTVGDNKDVKTANAITEVDKWMLLAKSIGATYVILTSKHHDGFCLWPTSTTNFNSMKTGAKQDLLAIFKAAALRHNLKFGIYYSWSEFNIGCTKKYMDEVVKPQIKELIAYKADRWWFDHRRERCSRRGPPA